MVLFISLSLYHFGYFSYNDELEEANQTPVEVPAVVEAPKGDTIEKPKVATPGAKPDGMDTDSLPRDRTAAAARFKC